MAHICTRLYMQSLQVFMGQWAETSPDEFTALLQELVDMHKQVHCALPDSLNSNRVVVLQACL
jgi:hypothetical protein